MSTLFQFNTSAVDLLSGSGLRGMVEDAYAMVEAEVREQLEARSPGVDYDISWEGDRLVVAMDAEQAASEFGLPGQPINPTVRTSLLASAESLRSRLVIRV